MDWLNYHHLLYFRLVCREGSVTAAAKKLRLAQSTVSAQLKQLEAALGVKLFSRSGRSLQLTEDGRSALRYADEIFLLGREMTEGLRGQKETASSLQVGVAESLPKLLVHGFLAPALQGKSPPALVCIEGGEDLLLRLAAHELDMVLTDHPIVAPTRVETFSHLLGSSSVSFFASAALAEALRPGFPGSLQGAPFLLPTHRTSLRRSLVQWFDAHRIRPRAAAEFDDSALLKAFAEAGHGVFAAPGVIARELRRKYDVRLVGHAEGLREHFYAITIERRLSHPAIKKIVEAARELLSPPPRPRRSGRGAP